MLTADGISRKASNITWRHASFPIAVRRSKFVALQISPSAWTCGPVTSRSRRRSSSAGCRSSRSSGCRPRGRPSRSGPTAKGFSPPIGTNPFEFRYSIATRSDRIRPSHRPGTRRSRRWALPIIRFVIACVYSCPITVMSKSPSTHGCVERAGDRLPQDTCSCSAAARLLGVIWFALFARRERRRPAHDPTRLGATDLGIVVLAAETVVERLEIERGLGEAQRVREVVHPIVHREQVRDCRVDVVSLR